MLQMRPNCECCGEELPPGSNNALICSFECTYCIDCVIRRLDGTCPNCGGDLVKRPPRPAAMLEKYPASIEKVVKPIPCPPKPVDEFIRAV